MEGRRDDRRGAIKQPSYSGGGGGSHRRLRAYVEEDVCGDLFSFPLYFIRLSRWQPRTTVISIGKDKRQKENLLSRCQKS